MTSAGFLFYNRGATKTSGDGLADPLDRWAEHPAFAAAHLIERLSIGQGSVVVDLAAGVGRWTRLLLPSRATLIAIEPDDLRRGLFGEALGSTLIAPGSPEFITLPDATVDVVTCAQTFHRYDLPVALKEIRRALVDAGAVALLWSSPDESSEWVALLGRALKEFGLSLPRTPADDWREEFSRDGGFGPFESKSWRHAPAMPKADFLDRVASLGGGRRTVSEEARRIVDKHSETAGKATVEVPYRTELHFCRKLSLTKPIAT